LQVTTTWQDLLHPGDATDFFLRCSFPSFDPASRAYRPVNTLWLATLSMLVYRHDTEKENPPPQPNRTRFLERAGFRQRQFFLSNETATQAMLVGFGGSPPFAVLLFRGAEQQTWFARLVRRRLATRHLSPAQLSVAGENFRATAPSEYGLSTRANQTLA